MAHTVTRPGAPKSRGGKRAAVPERPPDRSPPAKGLLGKLRALIRKVRERPAKGAYGRWKGASGEQAVAEELDRLPDGWFIVNDVRVAGSQIDHVVLGPKGIFCLETKHAGTVRVDRAGYFYRLERRMWVPAKSPAVQNMRHIKSLQTFLHKHFDSYPPVRSVIVYVGSGRFELETLTVPPGNTEIVFFNNLREHLLAQPDVRGSTQKQRAMAYAVAGVKLNH